MKKQDHWTRIVTAIIIIWGTWYLYTLLLQVPHELLAFLIVVILAGIIIRDLIKK